VQRRHQPHNDHAEPGKPVGATENTGKPTELEGNDIDDEAGHEISDLGL
jgi:hypothetical protein